MMVDKQWRDISRCLRRDMTYCERLLWRKINHRQLGVKFRRQYVVDNKCIVDFVCLEKRLIIEIDGGQHSESEADVLRDKYLSSCGFEVIRFWNDDILKNIEGCLKVIGIKVGRI